MYESVPVFSELNKVQGFDPLKFLRRTTKGEKVLDLKYKKKLWFRLKYPNGRIKLSSLKITDQLAIIEARVFRQERRTAEIQLHCPERRKPPGRSVYRVSAARCHRPGHYRTAGFGVQFSAAAPTASAQRKRPKPSKSSRQ